MILNITMENIDVDIDGISLPKVIKRSLEKRGKKGINHRYVESIKEIQILCSNCKKWNPVYRLENGEWVDVNKTYWTSKTKDTKENYFGAYCNECRRIIKHINDNVNLSANTNVKQEDTNSTKPLETYVAWSEKAGGVPQNISLTKENDIYLKLYGVLNNMKKNQLINQIIAKYREENPVRPIN